MFGSKRIFLKISSGFLAAAVFFSCAPRYQYRTLAPVAQDVRKATEDHESVTKGSVELKLYKSDFDDLKNDLAQDKKAAKQISEKLNAVRKEKYTVFKLVIEKKSDDVVQINPSAVKALILAEYEEKEHMLFENVDESMASDFLTKTPITVTGDGPQGIYIVFPYRLKEQHMAKVQLSSVKINEEDVSFEFPFHGTDTWEKRKRIAQYTGMGIGVLAVIAGVVMTLN